MKKARPLVRSIVRNLDPYVPGDQPKIKGLIKLNTNENPFPPSPKVLAAVKAAVDGRLRLYPNPTAEPLREKLADMHRCKPQNIIVGNGSDELLALAVRAFVEPQTVNMGTRIARPSAGGAVFSSELFVVSRAGGHSWCGEECGCVEVGLWTSLGRGTQAWRALEFSGGA